LSSFTSTLFLAVAFLGNAMGCANNSIYLA
jgi:hypothetical protein